MSTIAILWVSTLLAETLFEVPLAGRPVRFGAPVPAAIAQQGLALRGKGTLQWRRLPVGGPEADPVWVEIAIHGPPGVVRVVAGDQPAARDGCGGVFVRTTDEQALPHGRAVRTRWAYADGSVDECVRIECTAPFLWDGETFAPGEACTSWSDGAFERTAIVLRFGRAFAVAAGVLPEAGGGGGVARAVREHLATLLPHLHELPGRRGAGDYARSGGVVTNLEHDTTYALLRCAFGLQDAAWLARARRSAMHTLDRDFDMQAGLPFVHGSDHRVTPAEPGHAWLRGVLLVGLLTADDALITGSLAIARGLATHPPIGTGRRERLRDYASPLRELEAALAVAPEPVLAAAADRLAASIARRFDASARTFRFGEGELGEGLYFERGWLTGGLLVPALQAHLQRRPDGRLEDPLHQARQALLDRVGRGGPGLPTHWRIAGEQVFAEHRAEQTAEAASLLDAFDRKDLQRLLRRGSVADAVTGMPSPKDPDLATQFTLLARCDWVWR